MSNVLLSHFYNNSILNQNKIVILLRFLVKNPQFLLLPQERKILLHFMLALDFQPNYFVILLFDQHVGPVIT